MEIKHLFRLQHNAVSVEYPTKKQIIADENVNNLSSKHGFHSANDEESYILSEKGTAVTPMKITKTKNKTKQKNKTKKKNNKKQKKKQNKKKNKKTKQQRQQHW